MKGVFLMKFFGFRDGTYDFQKRSSLIQVSEQGAQKLGKTASVLAHGESLIVHARSAEFRLKD